MFLRRRRPRPRPASAFNNLALFEVSALHEGDSWKTSAVLAVSVAVQLVLEGAGRFSAGHVQNVGVFDAKADDTGGSGSLWVVPVDRIQIEAGGPSWYHPCRSGTLKPGPKAVLGTFGEFHPECTGTVSIPGACAASLKAFIDAIPGAKAEIRCCSNLLWTPSQFQSVKRDFALL